MRKWTDAQRKEMNYFERLCYRMVRLQTDFIQNLFSTCAVRHQVMRLPAPLGTPGIKELRPLKTPFSLLRLDHASGIISYSFVKDSLYHFQILSPRIGF